MVSMSKQKNSVKYNGHRYI